MEGRAALCLRPWRPAEDLVPSSCSKNVKPGPGPLPCSSEITLLARLAKETRRACREQGKTELL